MCVSCNVALVVYKMEIKCKWKSCVFNAIEILTEHRSIECTRTIQSSCLHRSALFDYNRSIVYFRSAKPARAEFSNFYHLVSYALPPYRLSFVCLLFRSVFRVLNFLQNNTNTRALQYANFSFFSICLFIYSLSCSNLLCGFFAFRLYHKMCVCDVFMRCYLLFSWILNMTHEDNIWNCFRLPMTTLTLCVSSYFLSVCKNWTVGQLHCINTHHNKPKFFRFVHFLPKKKTGRLICKQIKETKFKHTFSFFLSLVTNSALFSRFSLTCSTQNLSTK